MTTLRSRAVGSPVGTLTLVASATGLRAVRFPGGDGDGDDGRPVGGAGDDGADARADAVLRVAATELDEYFAGVRQAFDVPIEPSGTPFQLASWRGLSTIPFGETVSYGEQAARIGLPGRARAVGAANGRNPLPIVVPCHRVIGSDGSLVGFGGGLATKAWLLHHERRVLGVELPL